METKIWFSPQLLYQLSGRCESLRGFLLVLVDEAANQALELLSQRQLLVGATCCVLCQHNRSQRQLLSFSRQHRPPSPYKEEEEEEEEEINK